MQRARRGRGPGERGAGDAICVPPDVAFRLENAAAEPFEAICCMAAGGMARVGDDAPFPPPWAV